MIKRMIPLVLCSVIFLSGCFPFLQPEEQLIEEEEHGEEQTVELSPEVYTPENYYRSVLYNGSYTHGEARGFSNAVVHNRLDLEQLELGLMELANERFDPEKYFFREGQYISRTELNNWLMRYDEKDNPQGINPELGPGDTLRDQEESQPRYLSHILEHNYLVENANGQLELGGIVIGLSMNTVYNYRIYDEEGRIYRYEVEIDPQKMVAEGKRMAEEIVSRLRSPNRESGALENVPIIVAMFQEEKREAIVPGNFIIKAVAEPQRQIDKWQSINEKYYFYPSTLANNEQRNDAERFLKFKDEINEFFDNYVGVVGKGFYKDEQLRELTIEIPIRFQGKAEIIALTQFSADRIAQRFPSNLKIQLYITSVAGEEAIVVRNPNEEPFIHIYR
ncbi:CamS family sex pheromone protein [Alkalihalobacillus sp. BA299]|uniref:CamS family sex pheromone protein n=1 Tax=Alkalihalobacillus sp. BA299 TaxID=2815938 RepID=UPI001ADC0C6D|nr:CamS family sex pheromone protein [Alkalihalobacillus sp. BA299]